MKKPKRKYDIVIENIRGKSEKQSDELRNEILTLLQKYRQASVVVFYGVGIKMSKGGMLFKGKHSPHALLVDVVIDTKHYGKK